MTQSLTVPKATVVAGDLRFVRQRFVLRGNEAYVLDGRGRRLWFAVVEDVEKVKARHWRLTLVDGPVVDITSDCGCGG